MEKQCCRCAREEEFKVGAERNELRLCYKCAKKMVLHNLETCMDTSFKWIWPTER